MKLIKRLFCRHTIEEFLDYEKDGRIFTNRFKCKECDRIRIEITGQ